MIAETEKDLQHLLDKDIKENGVGIECEEKILDDSIKEAKSANNLGSFLTSDGKSDCEIKRRIALSKEAFNKKRSILTS